jgi:hypothetical protein
MENVEEKKEALRGRAAWQDRYRKDNPGAGDEVDDESLFEYANAGYSDIENRHNKLNGANSRLVELVAADPRLGAALSMVVGEDKKSLPYAMGSVYGKDWVEDDLEEFEKGYQENLKQLAESRKLQEQAAKNTESSIGHIEKYVKDNKLSPEEAAALNESIVVFAENLLMGVVPPELIVLLHKGLNYDQDVKDAIDTGAVQARNERIDPELRKLAPPANVIDTGGASGAGDNKPRPQKRAGSFYDAIKE